MSEEWRSQPATEISRWYCPPHHASLSSSLVASIFCFEGLATFPSISSSLPPSAWPWAVLLKYSGRGSDSPCCSRACSISGRSLTSAANCSTGKEIPYSVIKSACIYLWLFPSRCDAMRYPTHLLPRKFLTILLIIFPHIDHSSTTELGNSHSAHFGDFPVLITVGIGLAWRAFVAHPALLSLGVFSILLV